MSAEFKIRQFESADAQDVIALWEQALPSSQPWNDPTDVICRKRNRGDELFFVGEQDGRAVATVLAGYDGVRGWIYSLAVAEDCRRQGIGRRMVEAVETALAIRGCPKVNLQVRETNADVIAFYRRCGYAVEDRASLGKPLAVDRRAFVEPTPTIRVDEDIYLGQIGWDDKPAFVRHLNESGDFHENMLSIPTPYTELDAEQWLTRISKQTIAHDGSQVWAIRNSNGELIGGIGCGRLKANETAEIGYWLAKPYWGRGIVTAAVRKLCAHLFDCHGLEKIQARAFGGNPASARVLKKAGFTLEGTLRSHFFRDGKAYDILCFGLLRSEAQ